MLRDFLAKHTHPSSHAGALRPHFTFRSHRDVCALSLRFRPYFFPPPFPALSPGEAPRLVQLARQPCQAAGSRRWGTAPVSTCSSSSAPRRQIRSDRRLALGQQRRLRALLPQPGRDRLGPAVPGGNRCRRLRVECKKCD